MSNDIDVVSPAPSAARTIYFVSVHLGEVIHTLGFTADIHRYVLATSVEEIPLLVEDWCRFHGITFDRICSVSVAGEQDPTRYAFPEQILGYGLARQEAK